VTLLKTGESRVINSNSDGMDLGTQNGLAVHLSSPGPSNFSVSSEFSGEFRKGFDSLSSLAKNQRQASSPVSARFSVPHDDLRGRIPRKYKCTRNRTDDPGEESLSLTSENHALSTHPA
jgi:hypothetical protein